MTFQVTLNVFELASGAGLSCDIDPALVTAISNMGTGNTKTISAPSVGSVMSSNGFLRHSSECFL